MRHRKAATPARCSSIGGRPEFDQLRQRINSDANTPASGRKPVSGGALQRFSGAGSRKLNPFQLLRGIGGPSSVDGNEAFLDFSRERLTQLVRTALDAQGARAFGSTLRGACLHEAGHAVYFAATGIRVTRAAVRRREGHWTGKVDNGHGEFEVASWTDPASDLCFAASTIAGVLAELLFDPDFRCGSSLDEVILFDTACLIAASKLGLDHADLKRRIVVYVAAILRRNKDELRRFADKLSWRRTLRAREIAALLMSVDAGAADIAWPPGEGRPA